MEISRISPSSQNTNPNKKENKMRMTKVTVRFGTLNVPVEQEQPFTVQDALDLTRDELEFGESIKVLLNNQEAHLDETLRNGDEIVIETASNTKA